MPKEQFTKEAELLQNTSWRYIFAVPLALYSLQALFLLIFQRSDTPKWYLLSGNQPSAIKCVHKIYNT